ncbi:DUF4232 domain-containing protein [Streptomyces echinoruber]|uniref:DUF4232 domain-containing protein n=1 Tax=Streptomyces echinoruber TaxID=68898 RepID=UPI00361C973D
MTPFRTFRPAHAAALLAGAAALGLLTGCGDGGATAGGPQTLSGTAAPATGSAGTAPATSATSAPGRPADSAPGTPSARTGTPAGRGPAAGTPSASAGGGRAGAGGSRCHTSELRASVGRNDPGAGQENFPVVLTNVSGRTCTVYGYPGAAFVDAAGRRLGPDPVRSPARPTRVTLPPGRSAWAGLSFSNPQISGARTAVPAALVVTPPDERDPLKVVWKGGEVPVGGNASSVRLTPFSPGTGP